MKQNPVLYSLFLFFLTASAFPCFAQDIKPIQEFANNDRVLIIAPHPDDEVMAAGGVMQKALKAKARVKVLFLTNGDHNEPAFIIYEKRLTIRRGEFIHMGQVRRKESLDALKELGITEKDCIFLGYPDFGTMEILLKYWGDTRPFKYLLTRISRVPYSNCLSPDAPYVGESILNDIKKVIRDFKPTKVFVSSPVDANRDHRSLYLFLHIALWDLEGGIIKPDIFPYLIHAEKWPEPKGYYPDMELSPPDLLKNGRLSWLRLQLTDEEVSMKYNAMKCYKSQNVYNPNYLFTFARRNELFGNYSVIKLSKENTWRNIGTAYEIKKTKTNITTLAYARKGNDLFIRLALKNKLDRDLGISIFLLGYRKGSEFSAMPKLSIQLGFNSMVVKDKKQRINSGKVQLTEKDNLLILRVPLSLLNGPDHILACVKTGAAVVLPFADTAWRIIQLE